MRLVQYHQGCVAMIKPEKILQHAEKLINKYAVRKLEMKLVEPIDKRCRVQIEIIDLLTKQKYGLLANTLRDINALLPKLLQTINYSRYDKEIKIKSAREILKNDSIN